MQNQEQIVQTKPCVACGAAFSITDADIAFYDKVSPVFAGVKYAIPTPTHCPDCRQQRRLAWRNERKLYKRSCDATGKQIISIYAPHTPYKIYEPKERWSDARDALNYGRDFDFSKSFFAQFSDLLQSVPLVSLRNWDTENSQYVHCSYQNKNCYMVFCTDNSQDTYHSYISDSLANCIDCTFTINAQQCYACIDCKNVYSCFYCQRAKDSQNSWFCLDCNQCQFCFGCVNLQNKKYCFFNEQLSETAYREAVDAILVLYKTDPQKVREKVQNFSLQYPKLYATLLQTENCVGDFIYTSKNCSNVFDCFSSSDTTKHLIYCGSCEHTQDGYATYEVRNSYEVMAGLGLEQSSFVRWIKDGPHKSLYCVLCVNNCSHCFGCVGLRGKEYCILNTQYTKEEYEELVPKILQKMQADGERGEFFPVAMSPFAYNETIAQEHFPLSKEQAIAKGWKRKEEESKHVSGLSYIPKVIDQYTALVVGKDVAEKNIGDCLNGILICQQTGLPFKIVKPELDFYIKHGIAIPTKHPDVRHTERMKLRNPRKLWNRNCMQCGKDIQTTYAPDRPENVYCEACYTKVVYK